MQCAGEDGRYTKTAGETREVVPGVSSLTTCDELREARSEIKRVPENSRGSARSNYLHEARGPTVESRLFSSSSFLYFPYRPALAVSFSSSRSPCDTDARWAKGRRWVKGIIFELRCARRASACEGRGREDRSAGQKREKKRGQRYVELAELNTTH